MISALSLFISALHLGTAVQTPATQKLEVARVSDRKPNRMGKVLVLMYHRVEAKESNMVRSIENFKSDLHRLYKMGFRPVTLHEYVTNTMQLPRGASPVVFTWDDSASSQFSFLPDGTIDPNCAVGIWEDFAKTRSDFPFKGTFFVLPNGPFVQKGTAKKKLDLLAKWGCEIGSHTMTHGDLSRMEDEAVKAELADSYDYISSLGFKATSFAMPYGALPKNRQIMEGFEYRGKRYGYDAICMAGAAPAYSPLSPKFDSRRIQRIKAYNGVYGITYWLNRVSSGKTSVYVQP